MFSLSLTLGARRAGGGFCSSWPLCLLLKHMQLYQESGRLTEAPGCGEKSLLLPYDSQVILGINDNTCEPWLHFCPLYVSPDSLLAVPTWVPLGHGILGSVVWSVRVIMLQSPRTLPLPNLHLCTSSSPACNISSRQKGCSAST